MLVFQNAGRTEAKGLEFQLETDGSDTWGVSGRLGYALQRAEDRNTGRRLSNSPTHLVSFNAVVPVFKEKLFAGLDVTFMSDRKTLSGDHTGSHTVANLTLSSRNLYRGLEVSASIRNVFGETYSDPGSGEHVQDRIEQDGRSIWLKIKYGF